MEKFKLNPECFWVKETNGVRVVKGTDNGIFQLKGVPAQVFLAIAEGSALPANQQLVDKILSDLESIQLIVRP